MMGQDGIEEGCSDASEDEEGSLLGFELGIEDCCDAIGVGIEDGLEVILQS